MKVALFFCFKLKIILFSITGTFSEANEDGANIGWNIGVTDKMTELLDAFDIFCKHYWHYETAHSQLPFLDRREYVEKLARYIVTHKRTLIVGGPKDSGKTTGLMFMTSAAEQLGYSIIDINLKGKTNVAYVETLMKITSWKIANALMAIKDYKCVITNLLTCPAMSEQHWQTLWDQNIILINQPLKTFSLLLSITLGIYGLLRKRLSLILVVGIFCSLFCSFISIHQIVYSVMLLREKIEQSDWHNMFCCLRTIKSCSPPGPVLIIRDIKLFDPDTLGYLLSSLHVMKEVEVRKGGKQVIPFPVILETSDNLWIGKASRGSANVAFHYYVLQEMSYEDGKRELVTKYQLFNETMYNTMYESFRGHVRFYTFTWEEMFVGKRTYDDTLNDLVHECQVLIQTCLIHTNQTKAISHLKKLQGSNFTLDDFDINNDIDGGIARELIQCGLLYYKLPTGTLHVQNHLLEIVLARILEKRNA